TATATTTTMTPPRRVGGPVGRRVPPLPKEAFYGRDGDRVRLRGPGDGDLPGVDRAHGAGGGEGPSQAQGPPGRAVPDLRAGAPGADEGAVRLGAARLHRERQGG